jgi:hypothetical protein
MLVTRTLRLVPKTDRRPLLREVIRRDFAALPGLAVTVDEGRLLWGLEGSTCGQLLESLAAEGVLAPAPDGRYRRTSECHARESSLAGL